MRLFLLFLIFSFSFLSSTIAQNVSGRLVTSAYAWETQDYSKKSYTHFRAFETVQLDIGGNDLALKTYFQGSSDFGSTITDDPRLKFYNLYLEKKNLFNMADLKLGRVPIFAGMGIGSIDGAYLKVNPFENKLILSGYFGGVTPTNQSLKLTDKFSDNMMFGFQAVSYFIPELSVALSYMNRHWQPPTIESTRNDANYNPFLYTFTPASASEQYGSIDINYSKEVISASGKVDYDFNNMNLYRGEASVRYNVNSCLGISAEFSHKAPRVLYNSIFSIFSQEATDEFGGGIDYLIDNKYNVYARFSQVKYTDDNSSRLTIGVNTNFGALNYSRNFGYAGDLDNLSAQVIYPLMDRKLILNGGLNFFSYKPESEDTKSATAIALGGTFRMSSSISLDLQGQMMMNDTYNNDSRIYFKFTYWFLSKLGIF